MFVDLDDLAGPGDLAKKYFTSRSVVCNWRYRYPKFPPPLRTLSNGPVWSMTQVDDWYRKQFAQGTRHKKNRFTPCRIDLGDDGVGYLIWDRVNNCVHPEYVEQPPFRQRVARRICLELSEAAREQEESHGC